MKHVCSLVITNHCFAEIDLLLLVMIILLFLECFEPYNTSDMKYVSPFGSLGYITDKNGTDIVLL